jgi:arylsulfatase A-like enzyme
VIERPDALLRAPLTQRRVSFCPGGRFRATFACFTAERYRIVANRDSPSSSLRAMKLRPCLLMCAALAGCGDNESPKLAPDGNQPDSAAPIDAAPPAMPHKVIVMVWDGLRPDSVTMADTPRLVELGQRGVAFKDNHSTYPTFTMMNAASFATGGRPAQTGFYGNTFWAPGATGNNAGGTAANFRNPIFTEDYAILTDLDALYQGKLLLIGSLFEAAQAAHLKTAAVGKSGPAFLQDRKKGGVIIDEAFAWPQSLVDSITAAGKAVPQTTPVAYGLALDITKPNPTAGIAPVVLDDAVTSDPTNTGGSRNNVANLYLMNVYLDQILGPQQPDLSLLWFRTPDTTEHTYGPGSANYKDGLRQQDMLLGALVAKLAAVGLTDKTDIIVVSDHGHTTVSGPLDLFPLRAIAPGTAGAPASVGAKDANGFSVSGDVRLADLLTRAGFRAFDGVGCTNDPVLSGIKADGIHVYPQLTDTAGTVCPPAATPARKYVTPGFAVPATLQAKDIVIAANGGSDYLYVPDHDAQTVTNVVKFLQSREEIGAIFVSGRYDALPGTLKLDDVDLEGTHDRSPDLIVSFNFDETAIVNGLPGIEFESAPGSGGNRGMHGSFSPTDVHNTLYAAGPDFKVGFSDTLPTANVDVAPTVAKILGVQLPGAVGRSLDEALVGGPAIDQFQVTTAMITPATKATGLVMKLPTSPTGADTSGRTSYTIQLAKKTLTAGGKSYTYFDSAKAIRE